jgi:hypothetical protein
MSALPSRSDNLQASGYVMCGRLRVGKKNRHFVAWSEQPCFRPVCAVLMTAGHTALRGSGPAFDDALAHVGCPDRRIDRAALINGALDGRLLEGPRAPVKLHFNPPKMNGSRADHNATLAQLAGPTGSVDVTARQTARRRESRAFWSCRPRLWCSHHWMSS